MKGDVQSIDKGEDQNDDYFERLDFLGDASLSLVGSLRRQGLAPSSWSLCQSFILIGSARELFMLSMHPLISIRELYPSNSSYMPE